MGTQVLELESKIQVGDVDLRAINTEIIAAAKKSKNVPWWTAETEYQNVNPVGYLGLGV